MDMTDANSLAAAAAGSSASSGPAVTLTRDTSYTPWQGIATQVVIGAVLLLLVYYIKTQLVRTTKDFVIANRKIGFGFGVAGMISIWTWAMAVMMSAAQTYTYG